MATKAEYGNMKNEKKTTKKPHKEGGYTSIEQLRKKYKKLKNQETYNRGKEKYDDSDGSY